MRKKINKIMSTRLHTHTHKHKQIFKAASLFNLYFIYIHHPILKILAKRQKKKLYICVYRYRISVLKF